MEFDVNEAYHSVSFELSLTSFRIRMSYSPLQLVLKRKEAIPGKLILKGLSAQKN
jgi:hypothetical protein